MDREYWVRQRGGWDPRGGTGAGGREGEVDRLRVRAELSPDWGMALITPTGGPWGDHGGAMESHGGHRGGHRVPGGSRGSTGLSLRVIQPRGVRGRMRTSITNWKE